MALEKVFVCVLICGLAKISSAQTATVGKAENSGECSFTAVNTNSSTFRIICGGRGLRPEEASQLSQVLSLIRKDQLKFDAVLDALKQLAAAQKQTTVNESCALYTAFCNNAPNFAQQTINDNRTFGSTRPPPSLIARNPRFFPVQVLAKDPQMSEQEYQSERGLQFEFTHNDDGSLRPAASIDVSPSEMFEDPGFIVRCDVPCKATHMLIGGLSGGEMSGFASGNRTLRGSSDPRVVGFILGSQRHLFPSDVITLVVQSLDQTPISKITAEGYRPPNAAPHK